MRNISFLKVSQFKIKKEKMANFIVFILVILKINLWDFYLQQFYLGEFYFEQISKKNVNL